MIKLYRKLFLLALLSGFLLVSPNSFAQIFTGGVSPDMCVGNPSYVTLSNITITENSNLDFNIDGTPGTIIIAPSTPSLFQFEPGIGSISFTGLGIGSVTASLTVTATQITIELSESDADNETDINSIIISGIQVRAINSPASLQLQNVGGSGAFTINGFALGDYITSSLLESFGAPTVAAAGSDRVGVDAVCGAWTTLTGNAPASGDGKWTIVSDPDGVGNVVDDLNPLSVFNGTPGQTYELQWTISSGSCTPSTDNVIIQFDAGPSAAVAGDDQDVCGTVTSLTATTPAIGVGTWSFVSNPDGLGAISNVNSATSLFSGAAGSTYVLRWTITNGSCGPTQSDVTIRFIAAPTASQAGSNQNLCETVSFTLAANAPAVGAGAWTVIAGTATVTNPLSPTSTVTGIPIGSSATLRWRITNGACPASISDVILTNYQTIPDTDAGLPFIDQCNNSTFVMNASAATGSNTASWSIVSGSASITNLNLPTTTVTGVASGNSVTLRWTVSNGGVCTDKWDEIILTNYLPTSIANAGTDIHLCNTATFPMAATAPAVGTGEWSLISGVGTITDEGSYNTTVTGVPVGTSATLRWTVSNGICGGSVDEVVITNHPTVPDTDAGVALFEQCNTSTFIMAADPAGANTGTWTIVSGSATITNINSHTTTVTGVALGSTVTLRWTVSNGVCPDKSDDIILQNHRLPTLANAGVDIDQCNTSTFTLNGNLPTYGTGVWSLVSGTATITDINMRNTTVTGVADGTSATLRWTISNGSCTASTDDVVLYNRGALPAVEAGPVSIIQCNTSIFEMNASNPAPGIGTWSLVSGTASITNINSPTTTVTGVPAGSTAVLRWTISNGGICSPVSDDISLVNQQMPTTAIATAGASPINQCDNTTFTMSANSPTVGTGSWSVVNGSATITDLLSPTTTVTGVTAGASVTLRWSITNGTCPASTSDVILSNYGTPPTADAGLVSIIQCNSSTFTMTANSAGSGVGTWSVVSGVATITNTASPTTTITAVPLGTSAVLRWTITSPACPPTFDDILLTNDRPPSIANAGFDINQGANPVFTLNAQTPVYGTGIWTIVSGPGTVDITDPTSPTSTVTGVDPGTSATLRWTISNGSCPPSVDDVVLTNYATPPVADAGPPFMSQCDNGTFVMVANDAPPPASGLWTIQSGSATITNASLHTTTITDVVAGTSVVLRWTISDGVNPPTFDNITLTNFELPSTSLAGPDIQQCNNGNFTMNATEPIIGTGIWSLVNGTATITTNTSVTTTVTGVPTGTSATLRWTVTNGACSTGNIDDIVLTNFSTPIAAEAGPAVMEQCNTSTFVMAATPAGSGIGVWTVQSGIATITNINSPTTTITGVSAGATAVLRWTVGNGVCASTFDDITLSNFQQPSVSNAEADINQCNSDTFTLNAQSPAIGSGAWTKISGPGTITDPTLVNTTVTGVTAGSSTTLRWTVTNGVCAPSIDDVIITNRITPPVADADAGLPVTEQCNNATFVMSANAPIHGSGLWTIVSGSAIITNPVSNTTTITGVADGTSVILRWTISNSGICPPTSDDITLTNYQLPSVANAGLDIDQCANGTFTLPGIAPTIGTGVWTILSGPGTITTPTSHNSTVTGVTAGMSTILRWTVSHGVCSPSVDDVVLTNRIAPIPADAGLSSITQCNSSTFTMNASSAAPGLGVWTIVSGSATITNLNSGTTTVTGVVAGSSVVLRWTVGNGGICADTFDDITLINLEAPTIANAGIDINQCNISTFTLAGNPPGVGIGQWSIVNGVGSITNAANAGSTVTGVAAGTSVTLRWTISNGICAVTTDDVVITNTLAPLVDAGSNVDICQGMTFNFTSQSTLASASNYSSLVWQSIGTTPTGVLYNATTLSPTYQPGLGETGLLRFRLTATGLGVCTPVTDIMEILITPAPVVNAGSDEQICEGTNALNFGSRTIPASSAHGSLTWTHTGSGSLSSSNILNPIYTVGPTDVGATITFRLTVTSGSPTVCSQVFDEFTLRVNPTTVVTIPGGDFSVCEPTTIDLMGQMQGSAIAGSWSIVSGGGTLSVSSITVSGSIKTVRATYTRLPSEINTVLTFRLSTNDPDDSGPCTIVSADVNVTVDEAAKVFAGVDMNICEYNPIPLSGTFSGAATAVTWSGGLSSGQYNNVNSAVTNYNLVPSEVSANNLSYVFTLTTNDPVGVCPAVSDNVLVTIVDRLDPADITIFGLNAVYAENDLPVTMIGFPSTGVFAGDAVSGNRFFPNIAKITPLVNVVTYSVTDANSCVSVHTQNVIVNPITAINFSIMDAIEDVNNVFHVCSNTGDHQFIGSPAINDPDAISPTDFTSPTAGLISFDGTNYFLRTDNLPAGNYFVTYTYTNSSPATSYLTKEIVISAAPKSVINVGNICETATANFLESSYVITPNPNGAIIQAWQWDFGEGNGNGSTSQNPSYNYAPGIYNIKLKVTTNEGCSHESTRTINVGSSPEMRFDWTEFCNGNFTNFVDQTIVNVGSIVNYKWTFGDGYEISAPAGSTIPVGSNDNRTVGIIAQPQHEYQTAGQQYNVTLEVQTDVGCIESITRTAFILEYETPSPIDGYFEDFEAGSGSWFANRIEKLTPTDTSWVFGTPSGSVINSAASGNNAWWTGKNPNAGIDLGINKGIEATYFNNEKSAVIGPCQDLSEVKRPMISIDYWSDTQLGSDGAVLQYSTNGGIDWQAIGEDTGSGINWYNGRAITGNPGAQLIGQFGWTGNQSTGWRTARYNLDQIDPVLRSKVIFRIAFGSNNDNGNHAQTFNGFAFDNVYIGEKKRTVMVEYFTNAGINPNNNNYFDDLYDRQMTELLKDSSDFFKVQYHIASPVADPINQLNPADPLARSTYYGVRLPPVGIMDGILGDYYDTRFDGNQQKITTREIDRRALEDPLFDITITNMVADPVYTDSLKFRVNFKYVHPTQTLSNPVIYQVALVEDSIGGLGTMRNVLRKFLLGTEGKTVNQAWTFGQEDFVDIKTSMDLPIGNNNKRLYLVAFVQDKKLDNTKVIHQAIIQRAPERSEKIITGTDDDPVLTQVKDINVYPNPASRVINFATEQPLTRDYEWSIIDQRGVTVLSGKLDHDLTIPQQVELKGIADGVYIVAIKQGNRPLVYRKIAVLKRG